MKWCARRGCCPPLQERLFEQLTLLLSAASEETGKQRAALVRRLVCKVEEIHKTLLKHLAKEEQQLLPLLLQHFSVAEQARSRASLTYVTEYVNL